jgi:putative hemolysin
MIGSESEQPIFQLNPQFSDPLRRKLFPMVKGPLEKALLLNHFNHLYWNMERTNECGLFLDRVIKLLNIQYRLEEKDLERIPKTGPALVVMNHPFGGIEGIILASVLHSRRKDIKIMANYLLASLPELADLFIFVDPFEQKEALARNIKAFREALRWLEEGGLLAIFPAGEVSHFHFNQRKITDPPWSEGVVRIQKNTKSPVLPIFIKGKNSTLFQVAGLVHPRLRTALLPRELLNKQKKEIEIRVGHLISHKSLTSFTSNQDKLSYLRHRTYMLEHRSLSPAGNQPSPSSSKKDSQYQEVIAPGTYNFLTEEMQSLPNKQTLLVHGEYKVVYAYSTQIPYLLQEIGRLRELTFRQAGEGTGKALDLDIYDTYYLHLFLWNEDSREIIGAYRLGPTDRLLTRLGRRGLYVQTLFSFHPSFFSRIHPALELGRSFVRVEYQKSFNALMLLWKGIGHFVACYPQYRFLFGPVSISQAYQIKSRMLMVTYLKGQKYLPELAKLVKPKHPFPHKPDVWMETAAQHLLGDIEEVSTWVAELENNSTGVPVLLKQYIKLGGRLLGFNIDPQFSHVLDGLILVDLTQTDRRILDRYMGEKGAEFFLNMNNRGLAESDRGTDIFRFAA